MMETNGNQPALSMRGFMISLHQMNEKLPLAGPDAAGVKLILDVMRQARLNTLLFEYEAYYPWSGGEKIIAASNAYTDKDIAEIREYARGCGIEIIPLVQVFGHMTHVLRLEPYREFAENPNVPNQICPQHAGSFELVKRLIDDTLRLHPDCRYLHLGGDECEQLGSCPKCAEFARRHGKGKLYSAFMSRAADYVLSKGIIPIFWHDMALRHPESLKDFDPRVLFQFWHYGDASHGSLEYSLSRLLQLILGERIIGAPGARAEAGHGALHHHPALLEDNIGEMNARMKEIGALGTILTDWPDTGCSFFDSLYAIRVQGCCAWNGTRPPMDFRRNFAMETFGMDAPELPGKLDAIAGACSLARGFQVRRGGDYLMRLPYDFDQEIERIRLDFSGDGEEELYRLTGKRFAALNFLDWLKSRQGDCRTNRKEFEWYILLAEMTVFFLTAEIGVRKEFFLRKYFPEVTGELRERFQVYEYLKRALETFDAVRKAYLDFHSGFTPERNLKNSADELFPAALKKGLEKLPVS